ncbi:MAG: SUMF1/EgtB/PvdO family nonheme iron enzyme [Candidatus Omnitrophota bacterium]
MKKLFFLALLLLPALAYPADFNAQEMVLVPAGSFEMGSNDFKNATVHTVTLTNDFYIGKYETTNRQYADVLNYALGKGYLDTNSLAEGAKKREARGVSKSPYKYQDVWDEHSQIMFVDGKFQVRAGKERNPVLELTWYGAVFYCNMLSEREGISPLYNLDDWSCQVYGKTGYRLPTEAEWEYAAKYNDARKYPWGNEKPDATYAHIRQKLASPSDDGSAVVGTYSPKGDSQLGLCDMAGNVGEWCNDWYNYYKPDVQVDPIGPGPSLFINLPIFKEFQPLRVVRGGCYLFDPNFRKEMGPPFIIDCVIYDEATNTSYRSFDYKKLSRQTIGFRIVKIMATDKTVPANTAAEQ